MTEHTSGDPDADDRFVRLDDGDMHVMEDGKPDAPAVLLIHRTAGSTAWWDPVVPRLADAYRVIRVDLLGHGRSASPTDGSDIPTQARRVGAALDRIGAGRVAVIGHSTGGTVATALAEQRPDAVAALALIDTGPSSDAYISQGLLPRLLLAPLPGRLLWRLRTEATIRKVIAHRLHTPYRHSRRHHRGHAGDDPSRRRGDSACIPGLPRAADPSRPASPAGPTGASGLRHRRPPVALLVGSRLPHCARRPRRVAAGRGTHPDAGRPANDREIAAGLCRTRRAPQLTAPRNGHPQPNRAFAQLCTQLRPSSTCSTASAAPSGIRAYASRGLAGVLRQPRPRVRGAMGMNTRRLARPPCEPKGSFMEITDVRRSWPALTATRSLSPGASPAGE